MHKKDAKSFGWGRRYFCPACTTCVLELIAHRRGLRVAHFSVDVFKRTTEAGAIAITPMVGTDHFIGDAHRSKHATLTPLYNALCLYQKHLQG